MNVLQALLLGLLCYLGSLSGAFVVGPTGGWYVLSRPLVASFFVGLVLGDVKSAILIGVAVQTVYIALITPGGAVPSDMSAVSYIAIPFAVINKWTPEQATAFAAAFGLAGVLIWNVISVGGAYWAHLSDRYAEEGNLDGIIRVNYLAQIPNFLLRGVLTFLILYFGQGVSAGITDFIKNSIPWFNDFLGLLGGALPALGIAILTFQIATSNKMMLWFFLGFLTVIYLKVNTVGLAAFGAVAAVIYYLYLAKMEEQEA